MSIGTIADPRYYVAAMVPEAAAPEVALSQGRWFGEGAAALGLVPAEVEPGLLAQLLAGKAPDGQSLGQLQRYTDGRSRQRGLDCTFSAPKSVSVLWALAPASEDRQAIAVAHQGAVDEALRFLEAEAAETRRGKAGRTTEPCGIVAALFDHCSSRAEEPQLHTHALLLSAVLRHDGSWGALHNRKIYETKMAAGALYRAELAARLRLLGYEIDAVATAFEVRGVAGEVCAAFSSRRAAIKEVLGELGGASPRAAELAALTTRSAKSGMTAEQLSSAWAKKLATLGVDAELPSRTRHVTNAGPEAARAAVEEAFLGVAGSTYTMREIVLAAGRRLQQGNFSPGSLLRLIAAQMAQHPEIALGVRQSPLQQQLASDLGALAVEIGRAAASPLPVRLVEGAHHKAHAAGLSAQQCSALEALLGAGGLVRGVQGQAGAGKSTVLSLAIEAWKANGQHIVAVAPDARAASEFERATKVSTRSLGKLLQDLAPPSFGQVLAHHATQLGRAALGWTTHKLDALRLDARSVLVVEGTDSIGAVQLATLLEQAGRAKASIVLAGRGTAHSGFAAVADALQLPQLTQQHRARADWLRDSLRLLEKGEARAALNMLEARGRLVLQPDHAATRSAVIERWMTASPAERPRVVTDLSPQLTRSLNQDLQAARRHQGELSMFRRFTMHGETIHEGECVQVQRTNRHLGLKAGDLATVTHVAATPLPCFATVTLRLDRNGEVVRLAAHKFPHLRLAYALSHSELSGAEFSRALVLAAGPHAASDLLRHVRDDATLFLAAGSTAIPQLHATPNQLAMRP